MSKKRSVPRRGRRLGKEAWILAARDALIEGGPEAVKVERIAKTLEATRAAFYWHFADRDELLSEVLAYWRLASVANYEKVIENEDHDGAAELEILNNLWRDDKDFDPAFDSAMRLWARNSKQVAAAVKKVDKERIDVLHTVFKNLNYDEPEALVRARVAYFQQVGYYALGIKETRKVRRELAPVYLKVLLGE